MPFLYLTTRGWKTGRPHDIEIWYVGLGGSYYIVAEMRWRSHWVQNIQHDPNVRFIVNEKKFEGKARIVDAKNESELAGRVTRSMDEQYNWSNGTIVELRPSDGQLVPASSPEDQSESDYDEYESKQKASRPRATMTTLIRSP